MRNCSRNELVPMAMKKNMTSRAGSDFLRVKNSKLTESFPFVILNNLRIIVGRKS